jgi:hypothetical protein
MLSVVMLNVVGPIITIIVFIHSWRKLVFKRIRVILDISAVSSDNEIVLTAIPDATLCKIAP